MGDILDKTLGRVLAFFLSFSLLIVRQYISWKTPCDRFTDNAPGYGVVIFVRVPQKDLVNTHQSAFKKK
jgi:hypothetical protein